MARDENFEKSLRKARRRVYYLLNERTRKFSEAMSRMLCEVFRDRARARLLANAAPKDANSEMLVANLANSIECRQVSSGYWSVKIPADEEGLFMFLEFGTGLIGEENRFNNIEGDENKSLLQNWISDTGWADKDSRGKNFFNGGWVFKYDKKPYVPYLDEFDSFPLTHERKHTKKGQAEHTVSSYQRRSKKGNVYTVSKYTRKAKERSASPFAKNQRTEDNRRAFTSGLMPIRYIYDTKQEIWNVLNMLSKARDGQLTQKDVYDEIERLRSNPV